jgi:hypothetical protein
MFRNYIASIITLIVALAAIELLPSAVRSSATSTNPALTWVSIVADSKVNLDRYFVGRVYHRSIGQLQRIAGHVPTSILAALKNQLNTIHVATGSDIPLAPQPDPDLTYTPSLTLTLTARDRVVAIAVNLAAQEFDPNQVNNSSQAILISQAYLVYLPIVLE